MPSKCGSCGAAIDWSNTEAGKKIPLDYPPEKRFIMRLTPDREYVKLVETWVSHFATCPNAAQHRRTPNG